MVVGGGQVGIIFSEFNKMNEVNCLLELITKVIVLLPHPLTCTRPGFQVSHHGNGNLLICECTSGIVRIVIHHCDCMNITLAVMFNSISNW